MGILSGIKTMLINWWYGKSGRFINGWAIHNEFVMKQFFKTFAKSGKIEDIIKDLKKDLNEIENLECIFLKEKRLTELTSALNILLNDESD